MAGETSKETKPRGRKPTGNAFTARLAMSCTPEYREWARGLCGPRPLSEIIRAAFRLYSEREGFKPPPPV